MNLTEGNITKVIILYSIPLIISSLIQQLYGTVDYFFAGRFLGENQMAALGNSTQLISCMIVFYNGLATGASVVTAQLFGAKRYSDIKILMKKMMIFSVVSGFLISTLGYILTPCFLERIHVPEEIMYDSKIYLDIYIFSMISVALYNMYSGIIRAMGITLFPLIVQAAGILINCIGNYYFVIYSKSGIAGIAWATFFSQTFCALAVVLYSLRKCHDYPNSESTKLMRKVTMIGIPSGAQALCVTMSNVVIQSQINLLGIQAIAAFTIYFKLEMIIYLPVLALGQTMVTFVGQNYGAGKYERMRKGTKLCFLYSEVITIMIAIIVCLEAVPLIQIFSNQSDIIVIARKIMLITFLSYFLYSIIESSSCYMRGRGNSFYPLVVTIVTFCMIKVILVILLNRKYHTAEGVALCYPISWVIAAVVMLIGMMRYFRNGEKETILH